MLVPRRVAVPVVVTVVLLGILTIGFSHLVLPSMFETWKHHVGVDSWSIAARLFYRVFHFGPVVPMLLLLSGMGLLRPAACEARRLAWWTGISITGLAFWAFWTLAVLHGFQKLTQPA